MIYGIGCDIVECDRVEHILAKHGAFFAPHILTPAELSLLGTLSSKTEFISGRWAAKEALSKAMGTGMCTECGFLEIEILPDERHCPHVRLSGDTAKTAERLGITHIHVSISHERHYAVASVVLEKAD